MRQRGKGSNLVLILDSVTYDSRAVRDSVAVGSCAHSVAVSKMKASDTLGLVRKACDDIVSDNLAYREHHTVVVDLEMDANSE